MIYIVMLANESLVLGVYTTQEKAERAMEDYLLIMPCWAGQLYIDGAHTLDVAIPGPPV